ncbi:MAG TPA: mechanosensitive ion channel domain-containing protein [Opitutaceae bacterium]|nr:mechanosensitive ion channel domain-containing protein [Opitutaceae bacterium]
MRFLSDPRVQLLAVLLITTLLFVYVVRRAIAHLVRRADRRAAPETRGLWVRLLHAALGPLSLLVWYYGFYAMAHLATVDGWVAGDWRWAEGALRQVAGIGLVAAVLWFLFRASQVLESFLRKVAARTPSRLDDIFLPLLGTSLRLLAPILALLLFVRMWPLSEDGIDIAQKLLAIALIAAVTWLLRNAILLVEAAIVRQSDAAGGMGFAARALATRVSVLRKIALVLLTLFALASMLMLFPQVRHIGQSILASAGIAGIVLGFAAQKTLGNLLAGIQIALTQPIRIGDLVMVENELGNVEEITLTYVVVRIWDLRRLVLPIGYFIEKPIQNWTRNSENLLSPVLLRVDYTLPVEEFRAHMKSVIERSPNWDKKVFAVHVTGMDGGSMEVRVLGSAVGPGESFNLQCELREEAMDYLTRRCPQCFANFRPDRKPAVPTP